MTVERAEVAVGETVATVEIMAATDGTAVIMVGIGIEEATESTTVTFGRGIGIPEISGTLEVAGIKTGIAETGIQGITGIGDQGMRIGDQGTGIANGTMIGEILIVVVVPMATVVCIVVTHPQDNLVVTMATNYRGSLVLTRRDSP